MQKGRGINLALHPPALIRAGFCPTPPMKGFAALRLKCIYYCYGDRMPTRYEELYAWIHTAFGSETFTADAFAMTFPSPCPAKVLHDLRRLGYLDSRGRGKYSLVAPDERLRRVVQHGDASFGLPERAGMPYAYTAVTAITIWTDGGYWTGFTAGFRPSHLDVRKRDVRAWQRFFRMHGARSSVFGSRETLYGFVQILHPKERIRAVRRGDVHVIPRRDAYRYAAKRPYAFEPVLPYLRGKASRTWRPA
jgi:hypothetical protein